MKLFTIVHPVDSKMNHDCDKDLFEYTKICNVSAISLNDAFQKAQNDFNDDYSLIDVRSTSVGDIIIDIEENKHYMVKGLGFEEIPHSVANYVNLNVF